jgi:cell division protein FtsQ
MTYLIFTLCYFSGRNKETVCRELEIELADSAEIQLITQADIALLLEQKDLNPIGKTIKHIRTGSIEETLLKNPMVKYVQCYKTPSGIVHIRVMQRCPKFRVVGIESYYIDADRRTMPVSPNYAAYVPVVSGRVTVSLAIGKMFDFVTYLEQNPFWNAQIEQIFVRDDQKIELVPRVGDAIIVLGTLDNYEAKLNKLHKLYVKGFNVIGWNRYKIIDLQYKNQIVCDKLGEQPKQPTELVQEKNDTIIANKL